MYVVLYSIILVLLLLILHNIKLLAFNNVHELL